MIGLLQRVTAAGVTVDGAVAGEIERGIRVLARVERGDDDSHAERLAQRRPHSRIATRIGNERR